MEQQLSFHLSKVNDDTTLINFKGVFDVAHWSFSEEGLLKQNITTSKVILDFKGLDSFDTFGAWQLAKFWRALEEKNIIVSFKSPFNDILDSMEEMKTLSLPPVLAEKLGAPGPNFIQLIGNRFLLGGGQFFRLVSFFGTVILAMGHCIRCPSSFRYKSFIKYLDETGVRAMPIIGLVSLLIGVVLVYQGVSQLQRFGAEIFTVNLLAVSVLRELGILMTAIVVAGRSGSAITAQIGFMKLNQELDAMKVLGLDPLQLLIVPRILALMVVMPLLTIFSDLFAIMGGGFMSMELVDLSFSQFLTQLQSSFEPSSFWIGIIKAPVFAFFIGFIACYEGLRVSGGAESVGRRTTKSVVKSIFMVLVLNAAFSVIFAILKV